MPVENRPVKKGFAREVVGLRLWEPQDNQTIDELRALWAQHPVLVFRRQALSEHELADFSALFGPLERVVRTEWASPVRPEVGLISNLKDAQAKPIGGLGDGEIQWHSDQSYMLNPATGAMLYALELPPEGGATSWVDLCAAYAGLPDRLKRAVEGRRAILSYVKACRLPGRRDDDCRREGARANGHEATLLLRRPMRRRPGPRRQLIGHRLCHARDAVFVFTPRWLQIRIPRRTIEPCSKRWSRSFGLHAHRASGVARAAE